MTSHTKKLLDEALLLPAAQREALAAKLFESLDSADLSAEVAWQEEIERRIAEPDQGIVRPIPWSESAADDLRGWR